MKRILGVTFVLVLTSVSSMLFAKSNVHLFMPPNDLHLEDDVSFTENISQTDFNAVINRAYQYYGPIVESFGAKLIIHGLWSNSTVNASAYQEGNEWHVEMYGGLARRQEITKEGFATVLSHELGHHLGGFPYIEDWASAEGMSDMFSTHAAAKVIWANDPSNEDFPTKIDSYSKQRCDQVWADQNNRKLCYRSLMGAKSVAALLDRLTGEVSDIRTPDPTVVSQTNTSYPNTIQCRLDTLVAGALCTAKWNSYKIPKTERESSYFVCSEIRGYKIGVRPRCWFAPSLESTIY